MYSKKRVMEKEKNIDNKIFILAFAGVSLLILSIVASLIGLKYLEQLRMFYFLVPAVTGSPSAILLYKAWKRDKYRLGQFQNQG
jgi:hypothetical protein